LSLRLESVPNLLWYICCPDCRGDLNAIGSSSANGFFCPACRLAFPTFDGVLILLNSESRNEKLEAPLLRELATHADGEQALEACERTLNLIGGTRNDAYAWEDEKHWAEEYAAYLESGENKNWNDRLWQRTPLFQVATKYLDGTKARSRVIVDVGCGEGQDLRHFLVPYLREE
jgi:uncharacterized protein YbaR (Trm112 family)